MPEPRSQKPLPHRLAANACWFTTIGHEANRTTQYSIISSTGSGLIDYHWERRLPLGTDEKNNPLNLSKATKVYRRHQKAS